MRISSRAEGRPAQRHLCRLAADMISLTSRMATTHRRDPLPFDTAALARGRCWRRHPARRRPHHPLLRRGQGGGTSSPTHHHRGGMGNRHHGSRVRVPPQQRADDFNFTPALNPGTGNPGANDVAPFKRPRSSMTPTILFKGKTPIAAYGSPGGRPSSIRCSRSPSTSSTTGWRSRTPSTRRASR